MNQKPSGSDSKKRGFLKGSLAAAGLSILAKPANLFSKSKGGNSSERDSKEGGLSVALHANAISRRKK